MPALAWLACLLCLALPWSGLGLSCLHCLGLVHQQQPAAFGGRRRLRRHCCCCWTRPRQGRQDRPRPDQAKARHNKQASQAKSGNPGNLASSVSKMESFSNPRVSNLVALTLWPRAYCRAPGPIRALCMTFDKQRQNENPGRSAGLPHAAPWAPLGPRG